MRCGALRHYGGPFAAWCAMLGVAVGNGVLRDLTYGRHVSELAAHQISTLILLALLGVVMYHYLRHQPASSPRQAWALGLAWAAMTLAFEFLFFHYAGGHPWSELIANYDVAHGRVWSAVPLWLFTAPRLFLRFQARS